MDDSNQKALQRRCNDLRPIAASRASQRTSREPDQEAKRRWAIVKEIDDINRRLQSPLTKDTLTALNAQLDAIAKKLDAMQRKDDAAADLEVQRAMAEGFRYEREQRAREASQSHQSAQPESSSSNPHILTLLSCILKEITLETWLGDHRGINRSTFMYWKAMVSGKPVKRKVSAAKAREFEAVIRREAMELGLM